ncbi:unnamed protein product [Ectocarpus fasciculatus]
MDSDYLHLDIRPTTLPFPVGDGVFAKFDIPSGEILCEYRGPVIMGSTRYPSDKLFTINLPEDGVMQPYHIIGEGICAHINDCADILGKQYTLEDIQELRYNESASLPTYPGYSYNAHYLKTALGKVFIASVTDIKANTEIFFSYGK